MASWVRDGNFTSTHSYCAIGRASLKSMHPSARKATVLSSLPLLMIPLPPALPTNHHGSVLRRRKPLCGSSALSASPTTSPSLKRSWCCGCRHRPATPYADKVDTKEERRESCPATEEEGWRACYGQIEQLAKELEMPRGAFSYVD